MCTRRQRPLLPPPITLDVSSTSRHGRPRDQVMRGTRAPPTRDAKGSDNGYAWSLRPKKGTGRRKDDMKEVVKLGRKTRRGSRARK
jgi:hypothetical protein